MRIFARITTGPAVMNVGSVVLKGDWGAQARQLPSHAPSYNTTQEAQSAGRFRQYA